MHTPQVVSQWTVLEPPSRLRTVSMENVIHGLGSSDSNSSSCDNTFLIKLKGKLMNHPEVRAETWDPQETVFQT